MPHEIVFMPPGWQKLITLVVSTVGKDKDLRKVILYWQDCTLVQLLWKTIWPFFFIEYTQ